MPEVIIKYKNSKSLKALQELAKAFDMVIEQPQVQADKTLPIRFAKKPNVNALAGIWKDEPKTLEEIRKKAWGDRM